MMILHSSVIEGKVSGGSQPHGERGGLIPPKGFVFAHTRHCACFQHLHPSCDTRLPRKALVTLVFSRSTAIRVALRFKNETRTPTRRMNNLGKPLSPALSPGERELSSIIPVTE